MFRFFLVFAFFCLAHAEDCQGNGCAIHVNSMLQSSARAKLDKQAAPPSILSCSGKDACKDQGNIGSNCPKGSGSACIIICDGENACGGNAKVVAASEKLVLKCSGKAACEGNFQLPHATSSHQYCCEGKDACKDANFGSATKVQLQQCNKLIAQAKGVERIQAAAAAQGINGLVDSSDSLLYTMEVEFSASAVKTQKITGCDGIERDYDGGFPAVDAFKADPIDPSGKFHQVTVTQTRETPTVTFECDESKKYHLVVQDGLHGAPQDQYGMVHWTKFNIQCIDGQGDTSAGGKAGGVIMDQGLIGKWYLAPAFPWHGGIFHFVIFETGDSFNEDQLDAFNDWMKKTNLFTDAGSGGRPQPADVVTIKKIMVNSPLASHFKNLVARSWLGVTTSLWADWNFASMGRCTPNFAEYIGGCSTPASHNPTWKNCTMFPVEWDAVNKPWPQGWGGNQALRDQFES